MPTNAPRPHLNLPTQPRSCVYPSTYLVEVRQLQELAAGLDVLEGHLPSIDERLEALEAGHVLIHIVHCLDCKAGGAGQGRLYKVIDQASKTGNEDQGGENRGVAGSCGRCQFVGQASTVAYPSMHCQLNSGTRMQPYRTHLPLPRSCPWAHSPAGTAPQL